MPASKHRRRPLIMSADKFSGRDWLWIIVVVASATSANAWAIFQMGGTVSDTLRVEMRMLDERWQERTLEMKDDLSGDILRVENRVGQLPPEWLLDQVTANRRKIEELEQKLNERDP